MYFDLHYLALLTEDELEDHLNWCRCAQKQKRRQGEWGLEWVYRRLAGEINAEFGCRYREPETEFRQLRLSDAIDED